MCRDVVLGGDEGGGRQVNAGSTYKSECYPAIHPFLFSVHPPTALTCACSDCDAGVCTVLDAGGSCYASLVLVDMVQVAPIHRGCYDYAAASKDYCGTDTFVPLNGTNYSTYYKVECCDDKDQCNKELSPALTTGFLSTPDGESVPGGEKCAQARPIFAKISNFAILFLLQKRSHALFFKEAIRMQGFTSFVKEKLLRRKRRG